MSIKVKPNRMLVISISIIIVITSLSFSLTDFAQGGKYGVIIPTSYEYALLEKINENRTQNGVNPLTLNATLTWTARAHSQDMIDHDFFDHVSSQQGQFNGATFQERVNTYGEYENSYVGECIACNSWGIDVEWTMASWKGSPVHWDLIINPNFREIGIGLLEGEWEGYSNAGLHTVDFGGHATSYDLSINDLDIGLEPPSPSEGELVTISATIKNNGISDAYPVLVKFYDGNPQSGGILIGTTRVSEILIHGEDNVVNFIWDTTGEAGAHDIYVVVDPDDTISESDEGNNVAFRSLTVGNVNPPINLNYGWNLVSFPYSVSNTDINKVLGSIPGKYDRVQFYDTSQSPSTWLNYNTLKPQSTNQLRSLDDKMGFWIHVTDINGAQMVVSGDEPSFVETVSLKKGWNLVGYPSATPRKREYALNNLEYGLDVEMIQGFDSVDKIHTIIGKNDFMEPGQGYFIFANYECIWSVNP